MAFAGLILGYTNVTVAILAVIMMPLVLTYGFAPQRKRGYATAAQNQIQAYKMALESYAVDSGKYPTTNQGLQALVEKPTAEPVPKPWHGPYLNPAVIKPDPWGRPYIYVRPPQQNPDPDGFDLYSAGPDGRPGTEDDVVSWK